MILRCSFQITCCAGEWHNTICHSVHVRDLVPSFTPQHWFDENIDPQWILSCKYNCNQKNILILWKTYLLSCVHFTKMLISFTCYFHVNLTIIILLKVNKIFAAEWYQLGIQVDIPCCHGAIILMSDCTIVWHIPCSGVTMVTNITIVTPWQHRTGC